MTIDLDGDALHVEVLRSPQRKSTAQLKYVEGTFVLRVPQRCPEAWVREFLEQRRDWMQRTRQKKRHEQNIRLIAPQSIISTEFFTLTVLEDAGLVFPKYRVTRHRSENSAQFYLAPGFFDSANQEKLHGNLEKYLLAQMMKAGSQALVDRCMYWAEQHGIRVKEVFVRIQKSRLGYCTHDDRIMLNGRLLFATQRLRDYVICHELAHTKHKNHSRQYWAYLEKLFPGAKAADRLLRDSSAYSMPVPRALMQAAAPKKPAIQTSTSGVAKRGEDK